MPLSTILVEKENRLAAQPLCLAELTLVDDGLTVLRLSSENLDSTEGGHQYGGHDWIPRLMKQSLGALQSVAANGIIQAPQVTLQIADADGEIWNQYEVPDGLGLKGAKLVVKFVFWDPDTNSFSTNEKVVFVGVCNAPDTDETTMTVVVNNILNLANFNVPVTGVSKLCRWVFPTNKQQRVDGALKRDSDFFECGYSPDLVNGDGGDPAAGLSAVGNLGGTGEGGVFTDCGYTRADCVTRLGNGSLPTTTNSESTFVQIERDTTGRKTGRFSGITYDPPESWIGREYTSGSKQAGVDNPNSAKYTDYFPMTYGTAFVQPPVMWVAGDPNLTRFEVVLGVGEINTDFTKAGPIKLVLVNDVIVPFTLQSYDRDILGWSWVNGGARNGHVNRDAIIDGRGDPYGSMICLSITVPKAVQDSSGLPNVRVLFQGPKIRSWDHVVDANNIGTPTFEYTNNTAWVLFDLLTWGQLTADDIDIKTFADAAALCNADVTYTDLTGDVTATHSRYHCSLSLRQRKSLSDVVNAVLAGMKGMLAPNAGLISANAGKLQLFLKQTLADQQPQPVEGSNYDTPIDSALGDGTPSVGYAAYHFDEGSILRKGDASTGSSFKLEQRRISDTPNSVTMDFQDEDFSYVTDTLNLVDAEAIGRAKQEVVGGVTADGVNNFDQCRRILQTQFAEAFRGNPRTGTNQANDSGGTWILTFDASFRAIHLRVGHLVSVSHQRYALDHQLFRVLSITPADNFERVTLRVQWHEDDWYLDSYGQKPDPILQGQRRHRLLRPPFGWLPNQEAPWVGDALNNPSNKTFSVAELYEATADQNVLAKLELVGHQPVNQFSSKTSPPYAPVATATPTGGTVPEATLYLALVGVDEDGVCTAPSSPIAQVATADTGTATASLVNVYWHEGTVGWKLYAGVNPNKLSLQSHGTGTPDSLTMTAYKQGDEAMPDVQFDHTLTEIRKVWHSGIFGLSVAAVNDGVLTMSADPGFDMVGRFITILGRQNNTDPLPIWDFLVSAKTGANVTLTGVTSLSDLGVKVGDVVVCRAVANIASANTIGDSRFVNDIDYFDPPLSIIDASNTAPIVLTLNTAHNYSTGDEAFVTGVKGNSSANGVWPTVTIPNTGDAVYNRTHVILDTSTGSGDYSNSGTIQLITNGLRVHEEKGRQVIIVDGLGVGQRRDVIDNFNHTTVTIDGTWSTIPDSTSVFIIVDKQVLVSLPTDSSVNSDPAKEITQTIPIDNYLEQVLFVQVYAAASDGSLAIPTDSPFREIYVFGGPGTAVVQFYPATFNIAVVRDLQVADDIAPIYPVRRDGSPLNVVAGLKIPSGGASVIFDVIVTKADASYTGSIFNQHDGVGDTGVPTKIVIPAGSIDLVTITDLKPGLTFQEQDRVTVNCDQIGTGPAGRVASIVVKIKVA